MAISVSIQSIDASGDVVFVSGKLIPSGSYTTGGINGGSGGDTVNWATAVLDPAFTGIAASIPSAQPPTNFEVFSETGVLGYQYLTQLGTTFLNSKLVVGALATFGTELASGAYPAVVLADILGFTAIFKKLQ